MSRWGNSLFLIDRRYNMSGKNQRQKEAERMIKSLESGLLAQKKNKKRQSSGHTGRTKGDKNVKSLGDGQFINQHGVEFSASERESLRQAVNSVKRKQKRILSDTSGKYEGMKAYLTSNDGSLTGILGQFSTSMNQFETREALENMIARLNRMKARGYETKIMNQTKENYIKNLEPTFKGKDDAFLEHLKKMSPTEFFNRRGSHLTDDFLYVNSKPREMDDIYIVDLVHSFGWLSLDEQLNHEEGFDKYTGRKIKPKAQPKKRQKREKK